LTDRRSHVPPSLVPTVFREYGALTRAALSQYLPSREPRRNLYDLVADYPNRGGKMMRPSLCIATARAFGGRLEDAIGSAVSLELLHNAVLIHDDVEDDSDRRRGGPALHVAHGVPIAINVGDTLTLLSLRPLVENQSSLGTRLAVRIIEELEHVARESAEGQAMELGWRRDNAIDLRDADYLEMVLKKTCWLGTIYPSRVGALIGTRGQIDPDRFTRFGFFLGAAFQIQDDLLNLCADERYGKEQDGDLWEGKRTLMLIQLLRVCTPVQRERLGRTLQLSRRERRDLDVRWMRRLMDEYECADYARRVAHGLAGAALEEYAILYRDLPTSRDKCFIEGLTTWIFERN
jgi:geranylgeranyl diphosphate synthase type II